MSPPSNATKPWEPDPGQTPTVLERYRVLGIIGKGGMGIVFKGFHLNLERHVAIKTMRIDRIGSAELVNRFRREIKVVGQMDHENVVRASDAGEKNGIFYLVMDYLTGCDLDKLITRHGPLDPAIACELIRQAALGLEYIHGRLVHRDIKPSNLLLTASGQVKILDLGLAHTGADGGDIEQTPDGYAVGTIAYMAPEQAQGSKALDRRADIYSLGCTLFKLLTGVTPYADTEYANSAGQIYAHCHIPVKDVPAFAAVPEELKPILLRMLAKNPDERFESAAEVARALAPVSGGNLAALLEEREDSGVAPLKPPLPMELSRLSGPWEETPPDGPTVTMITGRPRRSWSGRKLAIAAAIGVTLLAVAVVTLLMIVAPDRRPPTEVRDLDALRTNEYHSLLNRMPVTLGATFDDPRICRWNGGGQSLEVLRSEKILFFLGKTSRRNYAFDVAINQSPWSGKVGLFWGYVEDAEKKKDESYKTTGKPGPYFAQFQTLMIDCKVDKTGLRYNILRMPFRIRFNPRGEVAVEKSDPAIHEVSLKTDHVILQVEIDGNRLKSAHLGAVDLKNLYAKPVPDQLNDMPCQGSLGLITVTHAATFTNPRFICYSAD